MCEHNTLICNRYYKLLCNNGITANLSFIGKIKHFAFISLQSNVDVFDVSCISMTFIAKLNEGFSMKFDIF